MGLFYKHLRYSLSDPIVQNLQDTVYPKPEELESWTFERMFTPNMCHMHMSHVMRHVSLFFFSCFYKAVELVGGGSVINGAYFV